MVLWSDAREVCFKGPSSKWANFWEIAHMGCSRCANGEYVAPRSQRNLKDVGLS